MYNWLVFIFAFSLLIMNQSYAIDSTGMPDTDTSAVPGLERVKGKKKVRRGRAGRHGRHGRHGRQGAQGVQGAQGAQGTQGTGGLTGARGSIGATGAAGATGSSGHHGATGPAGPMGPVGPTGCKGEVGATGAPGSSSLMAGVAQGPTGTSDDSAIEYPSMQNTFQLINIAAGYPSVVGGPIEFVPTDLSSAPNPPTNGGYFRINPGGEGIYLLHYGIAAGANTDFYLDSTTPYITAWIMLRVSNGPTTKYYGAIPLSRAGLNHPGTDFGTSSLTAFGQQQLALVAGDRVSLMLYFYDSGPAAATAKLLLHSHIGFDPEIDVPCPGGMISLVRINDLPSP